MAIDAKYGHVTVEREPGNPLGEDEPVFLLRARDTLATVIISRYAEECKTYGTSDEQVEAVRAAFRRFVVWQNEHPNLVKVPD